MAFYFANIAKLNCWIVHCLIVRFQFQPSNNRRIEQLINAIHEGFLYEKDIGNNNLRFIF
jgi:hypothetical protein